ncbi:MAG: hypothetical protein HY752_08350 [Nitrospirae bacterium]|nr:hypothetical protein [Nitrospirota bacterium]
MTDSEQAPQSDTKCHSEQVSRSPELSEGEQSHPEIATHPLGARNDM